MSTPRFVSPMLTTLVDEVPTGREWIFERKLDGIRLIAVGDGSSVRLFSRNHEERTGRYPELIDALSAQPCSRFVVDGEVVAFDGDRTSFAELQQRSGIDDPDDELRERVPVSYTVFDLLHLDAEDLRSWPLRKRKSALRRVFRFDDPLRFCAHRNGDDGDAGRRFFDEACERGWEGIIAKRADSTYRSTRGRDWRKLKCVASQELVIGGYTEPKGSRSGFGALLVGYYERNGERTFRYAGRVGTGFDEETLGRLTSRLEDLERSTPPFVDAPEDDDTHWVDPELVAEIGFTEWTRHGRLRHPRYLGLRDDKQPREVVRERPGDDRDDGDG